MSDGSYVRIEIAPGELIDKLTILEIKAEKIDAPDRRAEVETELKMLSDIRAADLPASADVDRLTADLKAVNLKLWDIEDDIRDCERRKDFGAAFIRLARSVYITNDERARLKREINEALGSKYFEAKSYADY